MDLDKENLTSILNQFIEFCISNAECSLYREDFYGKEEMLIEEFLEKRMKIFGKNI